MTKTTRTTVNFPISSREDLGFLVENTSYSQNDVLRHAIEFYASAARLALSGVPVYVKDETGREIPIAVPGLPSAIYTDCLLTVAAPEQPTNPR